MTRQQAELYLARGMVTQLPADQRRAVETAAAEIKAIAERSADEGTIAVALVALELAADYAARTVES